MHRLNPNKIHSRTKGSLPVSIFGNPLFSRSLSKQSKTKHPPLFCTNLPAIEEHPETELGSLSIDGGSPPPGSPPKVSVDAALGYATRSPQSSVVTPTLSPEGVSNSNEDLPNLHKVVTISETVRAMNYFVKN